MWNIYIYTHTFDTLDYEWKGQRLSYTLFQKYWVRIIKTLAKIIRRDSERGENLKWGKKYKCWKLKTTIFSNNNSESKRLSPEMEDSSEWTGTLNTGEKNQST